VTGERLAAIDIGTNTVLLTIAERVPRGGDLGTDLVVIAERHAITRLGQGVDRERRLDPNAIARTLLCLESYRQEVLRHGATRIRCVGTSALRDAAEGAHFLHQASQLLGCEVEVVSGQREAELTFRGALSSLDQPAASSLDPGGGEEPLVLAFDIGGGSTEIVLGTAQGQVKEAISLDVGSVRLFERHGSEDFASAQRSVCAALPTVQRSVRAALPTVQRSVRAALPSQNRAQLLHGHARWARPSLALGIAGTMTTLWTLEYKQQFEEAAAKVRPLSRASIARFAEELHTLSLEDRRRILHIEEGRADVIPFGALVASEVLRWLDVDEVRVTARGVRYGLLLEP